MHCARSYHRGAIKKGFREPLTKRSFGRPSEIRRSHDRTIPRYAGIEPSAPSIPLSSHLRDPRLKPSSIESITCDDIIPSIRLRFDHIAAPSLDDHLLSSFSKGVKELSQLLSFLFSLIASRETRFGHICATITSPIRCQKLHRFEGF